MIDRVKRTRKPSCPNAKSKAIGRLTLRSGNSKCSCASWLAAPRANTSSQMGPTPSTRPRSPVVNKGKGGRRPYTATYNQRGRPQRGGIRSHCPSPDRKWRSSLLPHRKGHTSERRGLGCHAQKSKEVKGVQVSLCPYKSFLSACLVNTLIYTSMRFRLSCINYFDTQS